MCSCAKSHPWSDLDGNLTSLYSPRGPRRFYDKPRGHLNRSEKLLPVLTPVLLREDGGFDLGSGNVWVNRLKGFQITVESSKDYSLSPIFQEISLQSFPFQIFINLFDSCGSLLDQEV